MLQRKLTFKSLLVFASASIFACAMGEEAMPMLIPRLEEKDWVNEQKSSHFFFFTSPNVGQVSGPLTGTETHPDCKEHSLNGTINDWQINFTIARGVTFSGNFVSETRIELTSPTEGVLVLIGQDQ